MDNNLLKSHFLLREDLTFLNFGSFGACPKPVLNKYQELQREIESDPVDFFLERGPAYLKEARTALSAYVNCDADDIVYVTNPSYAVNIVAKSFALKPGDEVLTTNIEYGACDRTWKYYCEKQGAKYVRLPIRFPLQSKQDFVEQFVAGITEKTRLIFISHITSATALKLPVEEIVAAAKQRGIMTFVDGAHAPGQIPLDLKKLDADMYTGACHKWMMTAKGSSFLYVKEEHQQFLDPLVISWGYESVSPSHSQFLDYHQLQGTRDYSAFLTIPAAIEFMRTHDWIKVSEHCRRITQENAPRFLSLLNAEALAPVTDDFILQMFSARIKASDAYSLHILLYNKYKIQIPIMPQGNSTYLRYSIAGFNTTQDLDALYNAIAEIKKEGKLIS